MRIFWYLRVSLFYSGIVPAVIAAPILAKMLFFIAKDAPYKIITFWAKFFIFWLKITCNINYQVVGIANIPNKPCVVLSNHQSTWETAFIQAIFPAISWILKQELRRIPFFGWGLSLLKPVFIDRSNLSSIKLLLREGKQRIATGRTVVLFPEGTRVRPGVHKIFSASGAALAIQAKVDILPVAHNAGIFWPRGLIPEKSGTIKVVIGTPITTVGKNPKLLTAQVQAWIQHAIPL